MADEIQTERELMGLEQEFWQSIVDGDAQTAMRLTDDVCLLAGAQGASSYNREDFTKMMEGDRSTLRHFELKDTQVRMLDEDAAVVIYKVHEDLVVDGQEISLDAADSSTWVKR